MEAVVGCDVSVHVHVPLESKAELLNIMVCHVQARGVFGWAVAFEKAAVNFGFWKSCFQKGFEKAKSRLVSGCGF